MPLSPSTGTSASAHTSLGVPVAERWSSRTTLGFIMMAVGMFMAILDAQVVATSLPTIQLALNIHPSAISWIQTAYLIAEVIAIPLTGVLTRVLTMRWLFVSAVCLFTVASVGCASSTTFGGLIAWRVAQGFTGGTLIPAVFAAVFILFPVKHQPLATTLAGGLAVLAPTVGPIVGGWITDTYDWNWLFLINVVPGILAALGASWLLPRQKPDFASLRTLDLVSLALLAVGLSAFEIGLTRAPQNGWASGLVIGLLAASAGCGTFFVWRTFRSSVPLANLRLFRDRSFAIGCVLSFVLGIGLFGTIYLMPVFLGIVRRHDALAIGEIMLVTGVAQLISSPLAVLLERRVDPRVLTVAGFILFGIGLGMSAFQTVGTDFDGMFWPQVVRGIAIMLCLLPPTRIALGHLPEALVPDASGLFNLMRNLGGAVGLALIDSVIYGRAPGLGEEIITRLKAGDIATAQSVGIPLSRFIGRAAPLDDQTRTVLAGLVKKAALTQAINEAWGLIAVLTLAAIATLLFAKSHGPRGPLRAARRRRLAASTGQGEGASLCAGRGHGSQ